MSVPWVLLTHALHVLAGVTWLGGSVLFSLACWPALLRRPPREARETYREIARVLGPTMAIAGTCTLALGLLRGTALGVVRSWSHLATPYGATFLVALVVSLALSAHGAIASRTLEARVWDGDRLRDGASRRVAVEGALVTSGFLVVLTCMVLMHFGM
ncbi:hypothetical protein [Sandaracinus amylolyticus]|uniref:Copper resistance protein D domain-containing protein n=1 Tax=Sandaracinus amylolyticus TaxID=927083 RepID=A0A0F6VZE0_9BACT|nr:hypothetical protein [Sandaracinus amylolyticus]AKF03511.1 hypothetical protein DB32_000660 [Sandaracinus amylolyticus]